MVQWLTLQASTAGVVGLIPGGGTKISHAMWRNQHIYKIIIIKENPGLSFWKKWKTAIFSRQGFSNPRTHKYQSQDSLHRFLPLSALTWQETTFQVTPMLVVQGPDTAPELLWREDRTALQETARNPRHTLGWQFYPQDPSFPISQRGGMP